MGIHLGRAALFAALQCCLWGRGQRGKSTASLLKLLCEAGSISHRCNPSQSPQSALSLSFPLRSAPPIQPTNFGTQPHLHGLWHCCSFSESAGLVHCLTGLVVPVDFFGYFLGCRSSMQFDFLALLVVY